MISRLKESKNIFRLLLKNQNRFLVFKVSLFSVFIAFAFQLRSLRSFTNEEHFSFQIKEKFVSFFSPVLTQENGQSSDAGTASIFKKILSGIGAFFVLVGQGIASGISKSVLFLGQIIIFPVTATISLFSKNGAGATQGS